MGDLEEFEDKHGTIERGVVLARTGWDRLWDDPEAYQNIGSDKVMRFPGFSPDAIERLLKKEIAGIGLDTLSPDGGNTAFPVHHLLLNRGKFIIENLTRLDQVPPCGAFLMALPLKVDKGTEAPIRAVAVLSSHHQNI